MELHFCSSKSISNVMKIRSNVRKASVIFNIKRTNITLLMKYDSFLNIMLVIYSKHDLKVFKFLHISKKVL